MDERTKNALILLVVCALFGGGFYAIKSFDLLSIMSLTPEKIEETTTELDRDINKELDEILAISFKEEVLMRQDYKSLQDIRIELPTAQVSRPNPFAELP